MEDNLFTNKNLFSQHFIKDTRQKRLDDFKEIYDILKDYLIPFQKAEINEDKLKEYVELYQDENKQFIKNVLNSIIHIPFDKFLKDSIEMIDKFNKHIEKNKKYVFVIGVNNDVGASNIDFNIYKSNLWMFMLMYEHLKIKPYDILLNLRIGIQLYGDEYEFLIVDDCIYSGTQIVDQVLYENSSESLYKFTDSFVVKSEMTKPMFKPVQIKNININLVVPYLSIIGNNKLCDVGLLTSLNIIKYNKYIVNSFKNVLNVDDLIKLFEFYRSFGYNLDTNNLIPIFFDHKISDSLSTIELVLIKGQVLDNKNKRKVFIDACDYNKEINPFYELFDNSKPNFIYNKLYCPQPPYIFFENILKKNLK
jgi:hypothetical protein